MVNNTIKVNSTKKRGREVEVIKVFKKILVLSAYLLAGVAEKKKYSSIGGQAVIEGVMMRSPHAFVVALRLLNKRIRLRKDQWFGLGKKLDIMRKPFLRGILMVIESMANGIVALNYSANVAMQEELNRETSRAGNGSDSCSECKQESTGTNGSTVVGPDAKNHNLNHEKEKAWQVEEGRRKKMADKIGVATFFTMVIAFAFGIGLFILVPHWITIFLGYSNVESFAFHLIDGIIKALIFVFYIFFISMIPDIKKIFQYHGAEHKAIANFEAGIVLSVENAQKFSTLHPRCGTSFIFFLIFISIIFFSIVFAGIPIGHNLPFLSRHLVIVFCKIVFMFPVAGISYEIIKFAGNNQNNCLCRGISFPGLLLQKITTKPPSDEQLEVALASIKAVLALEEKYNLKDANERIIKLSEVEISGPDEVSDSRLKLKDFLEY